MMQAAVDCGGGKVLKTARGFVINIRRKNIIAVFEIGAAAEFVIVDVVDVTLDINRFTAVYANKLVTIQ